MSYSAALTVARYRTIIGWLSSKRAQSPVSSLYYRQQGRDMTQIGLSVAQQRCSLVDLQRRLNAFSYFTYDCENAQTAFPSPRIGHKQINYFYKYTRLLYIVTANIRIPKKNLKRMWNCKAGGNRKRMLYANMWQKLLSLSLLIYRISSQNDSWWLQGEDHEPFALRTPDECIVSKYIVWHCWSSLMETQNAQIEVSMLSFL